MLIYLCARFMVPLNESARRKSGHVDLEQVIIAQQYTLGIPLVAYDTLLFPYFTGTDYIIFLKQ